MAAYVFGCVRDCADASKACAVYSLASKLLMLRLRYLFACSDVDGLCMVISSELINVAEDPSLPACDNGD